MFTAVFWKSLFERAAKTALQTVAAGVVAAQADVLSIGWKQLLITAGLAAVASVVTSLASVKAGEEGTPSLVSGAK